MRLFCIQITNGSFKCAHWNIFAGFLQKWYHSRRIIQEKFLHLIRVNQFILNIWVTWRYWKWLRTSCSKDKQKIKLLELFLPDFLCCFISNFSLLHSFHFHQHPFARLFSCAWFATEFTLRLHPDARSELSLSYFNDLNDSATIYVYFLIYF